MKEIKLNGARMLDKETTHAYLKEKLSLPEYYGANLDALWDCLTTDFSKKRIVIINSEIMIENLGTYGQSIIELFRDVATENCNLELIVRVKKNRPY
jgi:ribonuclease inhibitor